MLEKQDFSDDDNSIDTEFIEVDFECERTETDLILRKYRGSDSQVIIPGSITKIGVNALQGCDFVESVEIPESINSIGDGAFSNCSSLKDIVIPNSVQKIGWWAFSKCSSLNDIVIPDSVQEIGVWAFSNCTSLQKNNNP